MANNSNYKNNRVEPTPVSQITASVLVLSIILSFTIGLIGGYLIGESRTEDRLASYVTGFGGNSGTQSGNNQDAGNQQIQQSIDYSQYVINASKGITVENFYSDAETKAYAAQLIGQKVPTMKWKDSTGTEHTTDEFGNNPYIIEIFSPDCGYCNASIEHVDAFRAQNADIPLISLTTNSGDISNFNKNGEYAFTMQDISSELNSKILNYVPWIPCFLYIENGTVMLVTYGGIGGPDELVKYGEAVFGQ